jgi:uncharacterized metal-binding protein YceD (DUF177 family)
MDNAFKIYVEQLREGHIEKIEEKFSPDFLDVHDKDLEYKDQVLVTGETYLAENELIINLNAVTQAILPCVICTEPVKIDVKVHGYYYAVPLTEIKNGIFNFKDMLREVIILESPAFAECDGKCPRRKEVAKFLKKESPLGKNGSEEDGYHPFSDLKWDK